MKKFFMIVLCLVTLAAMTLPVLATDSTTPTATGCTCTTDCTCTAEPVEKDEPNETPELFFQPSRFMEMLPNMGIGMLVIFIIIGVIILTTMLINKIFSQKKD